MSETDGSRKVILEKQIKAAERNAGIGAVFLWVGGFISVPLLGGLLDNIGDIGVDRYLDFWVFGSAAIATVFVFVMAFFPVLFLLGLCMSLYYDRKLLRLQKELNQG